MSNWIERKRLNEEIASELAHAGEILKKAEGEKRDITSEEKEHFEKRHARVAELRSRLERYAMQEQAEKAIEERIGRDIELDAVPGTKVDADAKRRAFNTWGRYGRDALSTEERSILRASSWEAANPAAAKELRALGVSSDPGASLIPQTFNDKLYTKLKYYGGLRRAGAEVITTPTGAAYKNPIWDDTANVGAAGTPGTGVSTAVNPTTSNLILQGWIIDSDILLLNIDFFQDQGVDLEAYLANALAIRTGRKENKLFTTGAGSTEPQGVLTGLTNTVNSTSNTALAYKDIVNLVYSVDVAYNDPDAGEECVFMCNQNTVGALRNLVDGNQRPLWIENGQFGISNEKAYGPTFMGYRVVVNNDMANVPSVDPPTNTVSLLFGNFKRGYIIRDVEGGEVVRFGERFMDQLQLGFMYYKRVDGALRDPNAIYGLQFLHV